MTEKTEIIAIQAYLKKRQITAREFQSLADISASTWRRIKTGETIPNGRTMNRIRNAFVSLQDKK